jgi:hypothetical protein
MVHNGDLPCHAVVEAPQAVVVDETVSHPEAGAHAVLYLYTKCLSPFAQRLALTRSPVATRPAGAILHIYPDIYPNIYPNYSLNYISDLTGPGTYTLSLCFEMYLVYGILQLVPSKHSSRAKQCTLHMLYQQILNF